LASESGKTFEERFIVTNTEGTRHPRRYREAGTVTGSSDERKIYGAAIAFAILACLIFLLVDHVAVPVVEGFDGRMDAVEAAGLGLIVAAPFGILSLIAVVVRNFTRSEGPAWYLFASVLLLLFVLLMGLMAVFAACFPFRC
jgi:hypothetical protein